MKKILTVASALLLLTACGSAQASKTSSKERFTNGYDWALDISKDTKTGCKYLIFNDNNNQAAITPLLKWDGTPDCGK